MLNAVSKANGEELTFVGYAKRGWPFSLLMLGFYVLYNTVWGG